MRCLAYLNSYIRNIQVSWVKLGFDGSLACLEAGANDFGGTLMEESISKAAGANFGEYVSPGEFRAMIRAIGRTPAERTTSVLNSVKPSASGCRRMPATRKRMPDFCLGSLSHTPSIAALGY